MDLPIDTSFPPMEARAVDRLPEGDGYQYEPKWDGFRCLAFRDGDEVELRSKSGQPLGRYFPDVIALLKDLPPRRFVLDGELAVPVEGRFDFEELQLRLHPAESRVRKLAAARPAVYILFDLLVDEKGRSLVGEPLALRRAALEAFVLKLPPSDRLQLSPIATNVDAARRWCDEIGAELDGIIAKRRDLPYAAGERTAMQKFKLLRTADCVVGGFRYGRNSRIVGSLLLGLYDKEGKLNHVGFTANIKASEKPELTARLERLIEPPGFTGRAPGGPSRWSSERSGEWEPLRPELVVEVCYDHVTGGRFRHGTSLLRWRPDKAPSQCRMDQIM
jgi:ATP-dependent DNA ligase